MSCLFRVNCVNDDVVTQIVSGVTPIQNPYATTVMPAHFRWVIAGIMMANLIANMSYEYFFVNGILKRIISRSRKKYSTDDEVVWVDIKTSDEREAAAEATGNIPDQASGVDEEDVKCR